MEIKYLVTKDMQWYKMTFNKGQSLRVLKYEGEHLVMYGSMKIFKLNSKESKEHGIALIKN